jgi:glucan biosynthesis protein
MQYKNRLLDRRNFLSRLAAALSTATLAPLAASLATAQDEKPARFSHDVVLDAARAMSQNEFIPQMPVPKALLDLDYDRYRQIRFEKDAAIWGKTRTRFNIEMFAPGSIYNNGIDVFVIENGVAIPIEIENNTFITPGSDIAELLASLDKVAGFRLHYPLNNNEYKDEFVVFQGASYFRAVSKGQNYGLSARGLAIDVAEPTGEEFPIFRQFWIERPNARSENIVVHALLDSKRVTGAYRFGIFPGSPTELDVSATLFPRTQLNHIGLGALTSMFLFGGIDGSDVPDYRNAVHDSNGLAILNGMGEYLWRPLNNPQTLQVSAFVDQNPGGFGLVQRLREQRDFEDLQASYHKRPSAWLTPKGEWGAGQVVLVEIPTRAETNDNIVAYWRPQQPLQPGTPFEFGYKLTWPDDSPLPRGFGRVLRTTAGLKLFTEFPQLAIDFMDLPDDVVMEEIRFDASVSSGRVLETQAEPNGANGIRLFLTFDPDGASMSEIRVQPRYRGEALGETMLFRWLEQ